MNFTVGIIAAVGILVAISLVMISIDPGYLSGIPVKPVKEQIACTLDYTPMCGVDGVTYGNMCMLNATKIKLDHPGECITIKPLQAGWQRMESLQHQGIGHESHQAVMILPLGDKVYSGTLQYNASEPVQLITLHGPLKEGEDKGQATWTLDGVTKYALTFVDQKNATGTWIFSGNALAVHTKKTTPFTLDYKLENTEKEISEIVKTGTIQSQQDPGLGESEQLAMILAPSSDVYSGIISFSASEPIQIVTMHGPLGPTERPVRAWMPNDESIYAFNLVNSTSKMGSLEFSGNALAVYRNNSTQFTVSYSVSATSEPVEIPHIGMPLAPMNFTVSIPQGVSSQGCELTKECYLSNSVEIRVHDTVIWSNDDTAAHTVTSGSPSSGSDGVFDSGLFMAGNTFANTFDEAGTYPYFCMVHPWMTGEIVVKEINDMIVNPIAVGEPSPTTEPVNAPESTPTEPETMVNATETTTEPETMVNATETTTEPETMVNATETTPIVTPEVSEKRAAPVEVKMAIGAGVPGCEETQECFLPYKAEIYPSEPVVWNNVDSAAHTVTSGIPGTPDGKFDSGMIMSGQTWQFLFTDSGEYDYFCLIHPWMTGKVIVS